MPLRVISVLDVRQGVAVHARGGHRPDYRPVVSRFAEGSDPLALALGCRAALGLSEVYVADLGAIAGGPPATGLLTRLQAEGFRVWADCGLRDAAGLEPLLPLGLYRSVAATESLTGSAALRGLGPHSDSLAFGLDLDGGRPRVAPGSLWASGEALGLVAEAVAAGLPRVLVLDLARVGTGTGVGNGPLLRAIRAAHPEIELVVGGGVASGDDLARLEAAGIDAVLVGSALHDGRIGPNELRRFLS